MKSVLAHYFGSSPPTRLLALLRFLHRDLRSSASTLFVSSICITLSVFLIVFISSISQSVVTGLKTQGRSILGGDVAFIRVHQDIGGLEKEWLATWARVSSIAMTRTMGRADNGRSTLVEVKAVDENYPLIGRFRSSISEDVESSLNLAAGFGATVDKALLTRLDLQVGDSLLLGDYRFVIASVIEEEPDKLSNGFGFGPRVIISLNAARTTGLVQESSLARWITRAKLLEPNKLDDLLSSARAEFPQASWQVRTHEESVPALARSLESFKQFLIVMCVLVLIIGGIGVSNSVRLFVDRRSRDFAILKALGASNLFIFILSFGEVAIVSIFYSAIGAILGALCAYCTALLMSDFQQIPFEPSFFAREIFGGFAIGFFGAASFSIHPLGRLQSLSLQQVLRAPVSSASPPLSLKNLISVLVGFGITTFFVLFMVDFARIGAFLLTGAVGSVILLTSISMVVKKILQKATRPSGIIARLAFMNIAGPSALMRPIIITFGLGTAALSTILVLEKNIRLQFSTNASSSAPDLFLIDIPARQADALTSIITRRAPGAEIEMTPMMRGRLMRINGTPVSRQMVSENVAWVLDGDRGITFSATLPKNSSIVLGQWWSSGYAGDPLVSIDAEIAKGLNVGLGDRITISVMGREITARISSLRKLEWSSLGLNFVFVFSPNTFSGAPFMQTAAVRLRADRDAEHDVVRDMSEMLPHVVAIQVRDTFDKLGQLVQHLRAIMMGLTLTLFALSILVLGSALAANQEMRIYAASVLVALGAPRRAIIYAFALEFILLGLLAATFGVALGATASWLLLQNVIKTIYFTVPIGGLIGVSLAVVGIVSILGLFITHRALQGRLLARLKHAQ